MVTMVGDNLKEDFDEKCELRFGHLSYQKGKKVILDNISGIFPGGRLIGILGPSGSGKTTLLNTMSGYRHQNATTALLQLNGVDTDFDHLQNISCYITQDIHLNDLLTVDENMRFAADFKLGSTHSQQEKKEIITELLYSFGLLSVAENRASRLSGGERKRLAIAMEMISDPKIIYMDEPTTGLDISTTHQILAFLKKLTENGKTVVCTIHQVCASHFEMFDWTYVVANGKCAYQGKPLELVGFLNNLGMPCNIYHNPADYIIELCCGDYGKDKLSPLIEASRNGAMFPILKNRMSNDGNTLINKFTYSRPQWGYNFRTLARREIVKTKRNLLLTYLRILGTNFLAVSIGLVFWNIGSDATTILFNYNLILCMNANLVLCGLLYPILSFPLEMDVVKREIHNKYYTILQYYTSVSLLDMPISLFTIITSNMIIYYLSGQILDVNRILLFLLFTILMGSVVNAIGFFFGTLLNLHNAIFFGSISQLPLMTLSGFAIMLTDLPWYMKEFSKLIYARNGVVGTFVSIYGLDRPNLDCPDEEAYCFYKDPGRFLQDVGIDPHEYMWSVYVLIVWFICVRFVTYFSLKFRIACI